MLISSQHIANVASIKHPKVNEISSDAQPDIIPREGNKGPRNGMLPTRLRCKQQKKQAVNDKIGLSRQGKEQRRAAGERGCW
jgi:hypothetical protein